MKIARPRWDLIGLCLALLLLPIVAWSFRDAPGLPPAISAIMIIISAIAAFIGVPITFAAAFMMPARRDNAHWRRTVELYRAHSSFRKRAPHPAQIARAIENLSDDELRVAAVLPDHSSAAHVLLGSEITRRGISPDPPTATVPSFLNPEHKPVLERIVFGATAKVRALSYAAGVLIFLVIAVLIIWNKEAGEQQVAMALERGRITAEAAETFPGGTYEKTPPPLREDPIMEGIVLREQIGIGLSALWVPCVFLYFLASWFRRNPVRILLLRKFNDPRLGKTYRRLARSELFPFGHIIALSDRHVRRGFRLSFALLAAASPAQLAFQIAMAPLIFLLRLTDRTRWGPAFVANARDYRLLARRLYDRMELNLQTTFSSYAYLVRSTDAWWREIIRLFMHSADVIVLDISKVTEGTSWEIDSIDRFKLWGRVVAIGNKDDHAGAEAVLRALQERGVTVPLCYYERSGVMSSGPAFRAAMFKAVQASITAKA